MVAALNRLPQEPKWAAIGGFAVIIRSAQLHRLTYDVDAISQDQPLFLELLAAEPGINRLSSARLRIESDDLPVDLDVMDDPTGSPLPSESGERAFVVARKHALANSEPMDVVVTNGSQIVAESQFRVATTASLIALKAVALPRRVSSPNPHKVGSDAHDLVRLTRGSDFSEITRELAGCGDEFVSWIAKTLTKWFSPDHDQRYTLARLHRLANSSDVSAITENDLTEVALLAAALQGNS